MISPLFTTIVLCAGFIWLFMKMTTKKTDNALDEYLERERKANSVRKQPLDSLQYISVNPDDFKIPEPSPNDRISELYDSIISLSESKIVNLTGITNTDLKLMYGVANLPTLTEYDQNFTQLCRNIYDLGSELTSLGYDDIAEMILLKGIDYGTDISGNYLLLADLYIKNGESAKINELIQSAESIRSLTKEATISKLKEKLKNAGGLLLDTKDGKVTYSDDNILPADILDILETVPYKSDDQKQ